jgi:hypothetical protein
MVLLTVDESEIVIAFETATSRESLIRLEKLMLLIATARRYHRRFD